MYQQHQHTTADTNKENKLPGGIHAKLEIGEPGDKFEREADTMANRVMTLPRAEIPVQRTCASCEEDEMHMKSLPGSSLRMQPLEEEEEELMPKLRMQPKGDSTIGMISNQIMATKTGGKPLAKDTRHFMSNTMGADFSGVRIHTGLNAVQMNQEMGARAFTLGNNIYFNTGEYNPGNTKGKRLLAHELTHVVQQKNNGINQIQRAIGDGHDLSSPRFATDTTLQNIYDGTGTLKNGDESESVRKVQHAIHDSGIRFRGHGIDGKFGNYTERWVTRFQRRNRVTGDPRGEVGDATLEKLDQLFPATAMPADATAPYSFPVMLQILCAWNSAMIRDLRNLYVHMVADLEWADERFNGTSWVPHPTPGEGETDGHSIYVATDNTNENVAKALYHEYQHARAPYVFRSRSWAEEESYAFRVETDWAIARGITPDPSLTTTDPGTGEVTADSSGISSTVTSYPGLDTSNPGEVIGKVGTNRVRVRMPNGRVRIRNAVANDTVPGPRRITRPHRVVRDREWRC